MVPNMASALLVGATGLVGSQILNVLLAQPAISTLHTLTRRAPTPSSPKLQALIESDTASWPSKLSALSPPAEIYFSALGTTRAQAGSVEKQRKIDYDLNLDLARAAKDAGIKTFVLISSSGTSTTSMVPYSRMKAELEEAVSALGFENTIIVRPGLLVGTREDSRVGEAVFRGVAKFMGAVSGGALKDFWAQDVDVVGKAAVAAGLKALKGEVKEKVWFVEQSDVVRLGRTEWKD